MLLLLPKFNKEKLTRVVLLWSSNNVKLLLQHGKWHFYKCFCLISDGFYHQYCHYCYFCEIHYIFWDFLAVKQWEKRAKRERLFTGWWPTLNATGLFEEWQYVERTIIPDLGEKQLIEWNCVPKELKSGGRILYKGKSNQIWGSSSSLIISMTVHLVFT